ANGNGAGYASFDFQVQDNGGVANGGVDTDPTPNTITVNVTPVNDAPVAAPDVATTDEDTAIIAAPSVLANDTDVDIGDTLTVSAVNGNAASVGNQITLASGAHLILHADGTYDYDPNGQFDSLAVGDTATDSFTYRVSDS